jgi:hypothetical protein
MSLDYYQQNTRKGGGGGSASGLCDSSGERTAVSEFPVNNFISVTELMLTPKAEDQVGFLNLEHQRVPGGIVGRRISYCTDSQPTMHCLLGPRHEREPKDLPSSEESSFVGGLSSGVQR